MKLYCDFHIHSRFARACSKNISIQTLEKHAREKGLSVLGTGDFQHPEWQKELKSELNNNGEGIYLTKTGFPFVFQTEISLIYSQGNKTRKIHNVILAPDIETVEQITEALGKRGRLDYDGRPIFGIPCPEFAEMIMEINKNAEIIPAHAWTPWFSLFGSMSGFDSIKECFGDQTKHIHAIETGLSSDPAMNWRLSQLDNFQLVSFSDAHSYWPWKIGRECTVFECKKPSYDEILHAIRTGEGLVQTIEFFPEEGKYHYDGHRNCGVVMDPQTTMKNNNNCPNCKRPLTIGVAHRIEKLADRQLGFKPKNAKPYTNLIPLSELIAGSLGKGVATKSVFEVYYKLIKQFGNEFNILLEASLETLKPHCNEKLLEYIKKNREQKIKFNPGYDGKYGEPVFE